MGLSLVFLLIATLTGASEWQEGRAKASSARLISEFTALSPETTEMMLGLEITLQEGWHTYWKNPGDLGYAPQLQWKLPEVWTASELLYPSPSMIFLPQNKVAYGYENHVIYPLKLSGIGRKSVDERLVSAPLAIALHINYLVCKIQCIPEEADFNLTFSYEKKEILSNDHDLLHQTLQALPQRSIHSPNVLWKNPHTVILEFASELQDLFIYSSEARHLQAQSLNSLKWEISAEAPIRQFEWTAVSKQAGERKAEFGFIQSMPQVTTALETKAASFWVMLFFAFLGGLILNVMPCVLPVFFLKVTSLIQTTAASSFYIRRSFFLTVAGIITSFLILGLLTFMLQQLGHAVGWGFQFQHSPFVVFMLLVIYLFALHFFDFYSPELSSNTYRSLSQKRGPFFEGVFATLLATPCTAPFLGTALAYALAQSPSLLFIFFFPMGLGLSTPYFFLSLFPHGLRFLPRPGLWMNRMRRFLGYSLLLAVLWLLYILHQLSEPK